jgi:hypothetical protein
MGGYVVRGLFVQEGFGFPTHPLGVLGTDCAGKTQWGCEPPARYRFSGACEDGGEP